MSIEEGIDLRIGCKGFQRGKELVAVLWLAAVNEDKAVSCRDRDDVCAATVEDGELVRLSTKQRRETQCYRSRQRTLQ